MPVAGLPRNPDGVRDYRRFHRVLLPVAARRQDEVVRSTLQEPGTLRRLWRNLAGYIGGAPPFSWTANAFAADPRPVQGGAVSTPLRYLVDTRNVLTVGNQLSRPMRRPPLPPRIAHPAPALVLAGNVGFRPTIRARVPSFGSRVPTLNSVTVPGAEVQ